MTKKARVPKYRLRTMKIMWGIISGLTLLSSLMQILTGNIALSTFQLLASIFFAWFAINPPKYVRKNFIKD